MYWVNDEGTKRGYTNLNEAVATAVELAMIEARSGRKAEYSVFAQVDGKDGERPTLSRELYNVIAYPPVLGENTPNLTIVNTH
jgi:hypothetical protein